MIGYLKGVVRSVGVDSAVIVCGGVGYVVVCPISVLGNMSIGDEVEVFVYTVFGKKEMRIDLYGFSDEDSRDLFGVLIGVSGVGAKVAMAMLNLYDVKALRGYIVGKNVDMLCKVPGVGKRVAERVVLELSEKIEGGEDMGQDSDLFDALETLGYRHGDIVKVLPDIDSSLSIQEKIRAALKLLNK